MSGESRISASEAISMRNMEGFIPNSGVHNVNSPRLRPVVYPVTDAGGGFGNLSMGWYAHHAVPVTSGGVVENPSYVYQVGGVIGENPTTVNRIGVAAGENPNFSYRVGRGGICENPNFVNQVGGVIGESPSFINRPGSGGIGGSPTFDSRGNVGGQTIDEGVDDQSSVKKVKFMCSFGGKILPRPSDGVLRYVGGQTRIISARRDLSFQELMHKMIDVYGKPVVVKYQLPDGELDALVSVSCPEDLENMMEEYGKLVESSSDGSAKLRVFLFSASELDPSGLMQFSDLLDSGQRYMEAVNGYSDGVSDGITRKVSIGSAASTQNSDGPIGGSEDVDGSSHGQGDGGGLSSPCMSSPRVNTVVSHDAPACLAYGAPNPIIYTPSMPVGAPTILTSLPQTFSTLQPETDFRRPIPAMVQPSTPLGYDMYRPPSMDFRPATTYMHGYVDPRRHLSSQVGYLNPHGVGITGSMYRYAESPSQPIVGFANQQFMPTGPPAMSLDCNAGMNTNFVRQPHQTRGEPYLGENTIKAKVIQLPVEQNYSAYQPQSPPYAPTVPLQAGDGCGLIPPAQYVVHSDVRLAHQPGSLPVPEKLPTMEECLMCQKALPHAHSDTVVQDHKSCLSGTVSDANLVFRSAHLDDNLGARPIDPVVLSGALGEVEYQGSRTQPRAFSQIDHTASELGRTGFPQDLEVQPDTPDNPGMLFSQGVIGKVVDVTSPHGVISYAIPQSYHEDATQQSSVLDQVKQGPLLSPLVGSDFPVSRPQLLGQEKYPFSDFAQPGIVPDGNHRNPIGTLPFPSSEVAHFDSRHPVESRQITDPVMLGISGPYSNLNMGLQHRTSEEVLHGKPALSAVDSDFPNYKINPVEEWKDEASGFQSRTASNDALVCPSDPSSDNNLSLFSNQDPWSLRLDSHFLSAKSKEAANEESFIKRKEEFLYKPSGHLNKDSNSEIQSNKDVAEEYIKQELKAVAEEVLNKPSGNLNKDSSTECKQSNKDEYIRQELKAVAESVAAMALQSSIPNESSTEISHGTVLVDDVDAQTSKVEDVKTKLPDTQNTGVPLSEGIGRLQIISNSDLEELRELGSGTFGTVYHGKWRGSDVAIKRINNRCFSGKPSEQSRMIDDFWNEAIKLADLHHPNVVAFYGVVLDGPGNSVATVTEFMVNGSLRQALQRALDRRKRILIAMDVAFGMEYLHGKNIVHFDLKSDNLLVNLRDPHRPICKVGDLGLSKVKCNTLISGGVRGTLPWMAPELLNGSSNLVSEKVDVFSFGIVMWELLTGEEPYADLHYGVIIGGILSNTLRPPIPESCDPEWKSLMERCWSSEPSERPSFTEIASQLRSMAASLPSKGNTHQT